MTTSCLTTSVVKAKNLCKQTGPLWALFCLLLMVGCQKGEAPVFISGPTMGTSYNITLVNLPDTASADAMQSEIEIILQRINQVASTYIPDSELMRFNASAIATPVVLSAELFELLVVSQEIYQLTKGAYDVTVGPVVNLWGFGPGVELTAQRRVPEPRELDTALSRVGFDSIELDARRQTASKSKPVSIDLSSVAKGYAVDKIAEFLDAEGVADYLVEVGGEIRVSGFNPRGDIWRIGIESPAMMASDPVQAVAITAAGLATSGDYRNFFMADGVRYSHTVDPRTGSPITHNLASVTVIDPSSARADALATGLLVVGETMAMEICEQHGLACFIIVHQGDGFSEQYSTQFTPYIH